MAGKRMKVVTIFDGQKEAKDVFAELIADRIRREDEFPDNKRENQSKNSGSGLEGTAESGYNQGVSS